VLGRFSCKILSFEFVVAELYNLEMIRVVGTKVETQFRRSESDQDG
jgi:hypothetical protein